MDREEGNNFHGNGFMFMGAIFMSNHTTKKECLQRNLFGLPQSQAGFLKKVKAGMLIFLFEHEERKLYGVFEATSDGALNIMPNAFISSGTSYPCQILFKRIWMCRPLTEDEFGDAIKENYYAPYKFNFGLSYEQVFKLIHLFSLKKIRIQQYQSPGIPNKMIEEFEKFGGGKVMVGGEGRSMEFDSNEHNMDDGTDSRRYPYPGLSGPNAHHAIDSMGGIGRGPRPPITTEPLPYLMRSTSQKDHSLRGNFPVRPPQYHRHHSFPGFMGEIPSVALGMDCPLPQEPTASTRSSMALQVPQFGSQLHPSQKGPNTLNMPSPVYRGSTFPIYEPSSVSLPHMDSEDLPNLRDYKHILHSEGYDPSSPRISFPPEMVDRGTYSLPFMHSPTNVHGHHEVPRQEYICRGQQFMHSGVCSDYIPLSDNEYDDLAENIEAPHFVSSSRKDSTDFQSSYSSESQEVDGSEGLRPYSLITQADEYYPTNVKTRLHSDTEQRRTSVFSRLHGSPKARRHYEEACKPGANSSLVELVEILSQRRAHWSELKKIHVESIIQDDGEQFECVAEMEPSGTTSLGELDSSSEAIAEDSSELPFFNFKRRSEKRKMVGETKMSGYVKSGEDEGFSGKYKRKRLVRP